MGGVREEEEVDRRCKRGENSGQNKREVGYRGKERQAGEREREESEKDRERWRG